MGVLDFLFQGQTPQQITNTSQNTQNVPSWLQQYVQGILAQSGAVGSQPFPIYPGPQVAGLTPQQQQASSEITNLQGGYQSPLSSAMSLATSGATPGALGTAQGMIPTAQGYIGQALNPGAAQINPYAENVIQKAKDQATQYWQQTIDPSINQQYVQAGQPASSANATALTRAAQPIIQNIQDTANAAYSDAFKNAQGVNLQAGQATGALGQTLGGLGYEQGILGLQGGNTLGQLGALNQTLGLQGAGALNTIGGQQQNLNQQNLNTAYNNFVQQQQYPYQQLGWLSQMLGGTAGPGMVARGTTSQTQQVVPPWNQSPSPLSQATSLFTGLNGARGGHLRLYRRAA